MPLSRLEIEQTAHDRWVAEVEVGGISNYRITVRGNTFAQIIAECERAYYEKRPDERPELAKLFERSQRAIREAYAEAGGAAREEPAPASVLGEIFSPEVAQRISADTGGYMPKPKRALSEEHKRAMAEGRAKARAARDLEDIEDVDAGPSAA